MLDTPDPNFKNYLSKQVDPCTQLGALGWIFNNDINNVWETWKESQKATPAVDEEITKGGLIPDNSGTPISVTS